MRNRPLKLVPVLALALAAVALPGAVPQLTPTAQACGSYMPSYEGVVKAINLRQRKVIITYQDAATQTVTTASFSSWDREQLTQLKPQDRVLFEFYPADAQGRFQLSSIRVLSSSDAQS